MGQPGTNHKCSNYQGVLTFLVSLHDKTHFGPITCGLYRCPYFQVSQLTGFPVHYTFRIQYNLENVTFHAISFTGLTTAFLERELIPGCETII